MATKDRSEGLSYRQARVLLRLKELPVPPAPEIPPGFLSAPAHGLGMGKGFLLLAAAFFSCWLLLNFIQVPKAWLVNGNVPRDSLLALQANETLTLRIPDGRGIFTFHGPGHLRLGELHRDFLTGQIGGELHLLDGRLVADLSPLQAKHLTLHTPLLATRVTGTRFLLSHHPERGTELVLLQGKVESRVHSEWIPVRQGTRLTVSPQGQLRQEPASAAFTPEALDLLLRGAGGTSDGFRDSGQDAEPRPYLRYEEP